MDSKLACNTGLLF